METPTLLQTVTDPLITFTDHYKTPRTVTDPLIDFMDRYKTSPTRYKLLRPATAYIDIQRYIIWQI